MRKKNYVLSYCYDDKSNYDVVLVFEEHEKEIAQEVLDAMVIHASSDKLWRLTEIGNGSEGYLINPSSVGIKFPKPEV